MAIVTRYATTHTPVTGTWNTTANLGADDNAVGSITRGTTKNSQDNLENTGYGFDGVIPANATINQVDIEVEHRVASSSNICFLENLAYVSGVAGAVNSDGSEPTVLTAQVYTNYARPGGGGWTRTDLLDANFKTTLRARNGNNASSNTWEWDYIRVKVDYSATTILEADGNASGAAVSTGTSGVTASVAGSASGVAATTLVAAALWLAVVASAGTAATSGVGLAYGTGVGQSAGSAVVSGVAGDSGSDGSSVGTAIVTGVGGSIAGVIGSTEGTASDAYAASAVAQALASSVGTSTPVATGASYGTCGGSAVGVASVDGVSGALAAAGAEAVGLATVQGVSPEYYITLVAGLRIGWHDGSVKEVLVVEPLDTSGPLRLKLYP